MTDVAIRDGEGTPPPSLRIKPHWSRRLAGEVATLLAALMLLLGIGLVALDTAPGHRWLVDRLQEIETKSGLRIRIGRIEGSIFGESRLRNVQVLDPQEESDHAIAALNDRIVADERVVAVQLTVRDGVTLVRRA